MPSPQATDQPVPPVFAGLTGGIHTLTLRLAHKLTEAGVDVQRNVTARELSQRADGRFEIITGPVPDPSLLIANDVVVAVPPPAAARLLGRVAPEAAFQLAAIEMASMAIVTLAFPAAVLADLPSSGFWCRLLRDCASRLRPTACTSGSGSLQPDEGKAMTAAMLRSCVFLWGATAKSALCSEATWRSSRWR
ncbi:hypothetical protein L0A91_05115 [Ornithinimicrobium sp. INDO-MA30-4]|nr:FAD-dependent oxidoreductase [Ornithinimicrobium sp. INDO-MA30-4]UJH71204.1 hypothetical protein L0A91_05115 [Ornithinimicrobium sp. INDO-MA30-4]